MVNFVVLKFMLLINILLLYILEWSVSLIILDFFKLGNGLIFIGFFDE